MKLQRWMNDCGSTSLFNAAEFLDVEVDRDLLDHACGLGREGVEEDGLIMGGLAFDMEVEPYRSTDSDQAYRWLCGSLVLGEPVICAVENWDHWVLALCGTTGGKILVMDPAHGACFVTEEGLREWWEYPEEESEPFYALAVRRL